MADSSNPFQPPTPTQKAEARAKLEQARQENLAVQQQRQQAPGSIRTGSPEETRVRAEEAKAEQQRMVQENVSRIGSSTDRFAQAREQAIKTGRFDTTGSDRQIPQSFITSKGQRIERETKPMIQGRNESRQSIVTINIPTPSPVKEIERNLFNAEKKREPSTPAMKSELSLKLEQAQAEKEKTETSTLFGKTFQTFRPTSEKQSGEISSFLKVPFSGQKAKGGEIPSTSLADVFAFVPLGSIEKGAVSAGKELAGFFTRAFSKEAPKVTEQAAKVGTSDIGLNVPKYTEKFRTEKNIQSMISEKMKTPPPEMAKAVREVTPTPEIQVKLGSGPGKMISTGKGGTSIIEGTGKPPSTPTEKTVSVGRGLEQIVRQKPVTKTIQRQKPEFEQKQLSKQEQFLKEQEKTKTEQQSKTETVQKQKQEETLIQKTGLRFIKTSKQTQKQELVPPIPIIKPRQAEKEKPKPLIPLFVPIQKQTQKQKQDLSGIFIPTTGKTTPKIPGPPPIPPTRVPTTPPTKSPPNEPTPTDKKRPPDLGVLGVGAGGGLVGKVGKGGERREFLGNVPTTSIVGTFKRDEIITGQRSIMRAEREDISKSSTGKFVQRKSSRIL